MLIILYFLVCLANLFIWWTIHNQNKSGKLRPNVAVKRNAIHNMSETTELPEHDVREKRQYIINQIALLFKARGFRKMGNNFFKRNKIIGYCFNIQNNKWNNSELLQFTFNLGIHIDTYWLEHMDFKKTGVVSPFPKEPECAFRARIGHLFPKKGDVWYRITPDTDEKRLWIEIERDLTEYGLPFFEKFSPDTIEIPERCIDIY